jgi:hypothetical protein
VQILAELLVKLRFSMVFLDVSRRMPIECTEISHGGLNTNFYIPFVITRAFRKIDHALLVSCFMGAKLGLSL